MQRPPCSIKDFEILYATGRQNEPPVAYRILKSYMLQGIDPVPIRFGSDPWFSAFIAFGDVYGACESRAVVLGVRHCLSMYVSACNCRSVVLGF